MRTLLLELRPAALVDADLNDLLRQLAESAIGRARIPVTLVPDGAAQVPTDVKIAFYHIAQEALNNVTKHARARSAVIEVSRLPNHVALAVRDDGRGFLLGRITSEHLGLSIMQERADDIGATLSIESEPEKGTRIAVDWRPTSGAAAQETEQALPPTFNSPYR